MYQPLVQSILLYRAETWTLNTQQVNKLLASEKDFWRKSRTEKVQNVTIREVMEVGKNILEVTEEKRLGRPKGRWIDGVRRSMTNHGLTEENTRDKD
jgi:hypothetical protein